MSHTPGPWEISPYDETGGYDCMTGAIHVGPVTLDGADYGQPACEAISGPSLSRMQADARLIGAAPELLATARELLSFVEEAEGGSVYERELRSLLARIDP